MTRSVPLPTEPTDTHVGSAAGRGAPGRVAEVHGGYLSASSPGGQGSIFTLVLPRV